MCQDALLAEALSHTVNEDRCNLNDKNQLIVIFLIYDINNILIFFSVIEVPSYSETFVHEITSCNVTLNPRKR